MLSKIAISSLALVAYSSIMASDLTTWENNVNKNISRTGDFIEEDEFMFTEDLSQLSKLNIQMFAKTFSPQKFKEFCDEKHEKRPAFCALDLDNISNLANEDNEDRIVVARVAAIIPNVKHTYFTHKNVLKEDYMIKIFDNISNKVDLTTGKFSSLTKISGEKISSTTCYREHFPEQKEIRYPISEEEKDQLSTLIQDKIGGIKLAKPAMALYKLEYVSQGMHGGLTFNLYYSMGSHTLFVSYKFRVFHNEYNYFVWKGIKHVLASSECKGTHQAVERMRQFVSMN